MMEQKKTRLLVDLSALRAFDVRPDLWLCWMSISDGTRAHPTLSFVLIRKIGQEDATRGP